MSTQQSHYEVLGIKRHASKEEIRKAFLTLAKKYHPDMSQADTSSEFDRVNNAFKILSDEKKRKKYDTEEEIGLTQDNIINPLLHDLFVKKAQEPLPTLNIKLTITQQEALEGKTYHLKTKLPENEHSKDTCKKCEGSGETVNLNNGFPEIYPCACSTPDTPIDVHVIVPAKTKTNAKIVAQTDVKIPYKEVLVTITVSEDNRYSYEYGKPVYIVKLNSFDLVLGCSATIPIFDSEIELEIPEGTSPHESFYVEHPTNPALKIKVRLDVETPSLTKPEKKKLQKLLESWNQR